MSGSGSVGYGKATRLGRSRFRPTVRSVPAANLRLYPFAGRPPRRCRGFAARDGLRPLAEVRRVSAGLEPHCLGPCRSRYQVLYFRQRQNRDVLHLATGSSRPRQRDLWPKSARLGDLQKWLDECLDRLSSSDRDLFRLHYQSEPLGQGPGRAARPSAIDRLQRDHRVRRRLAECVERAMSGGGPT